MPFDTQYTVFDRVVGGLDSFFLSIFSRSFRPVREALQDLPGELRHPALRLMEGLYQVQRTDRDKVRLITAAERHNRLPTGGFRVSAFFVAARGVYVAAVGAYNDASRKSRAALGGYLVPTDKGQRPSKASFECADSRCSTEASGEGLGDAFGHRSPGVLHSIAPDLSGLSEGAKKTIRLATGARARWINAAPHFGCSALRGVYQSCRKANDVNAMSALQLEDYHYGRRYEWLVETVEERIGNRGFDAYRELGLSFDGDADANFICAMAVELGLIVAKMTTDYLQMTLGDSNYRPPVVVSSADPGRGVSIFNPAKQQFLRLPAAFFLWPSWFSNVDRILGVGQSGKASHTDVPFPYAFPALFGPLERARKTRTPIHYGAAAAL